MNTPAKTFPVIFITILGIIWVTVLGLDWSRVIHYATSGLVEEYMLSKCLKLLLSLLITLLVFTSGKSSINRRDHTLLRATFSLFFAAELFFFANNYPVGIGLFSLAQAVFSLRNCSGLGKMIPNTSFRKLMMHRYLPAATAVFLVNLLFIKLIFVPHAVNPLFPLIAGYSIFLCISLSAAIATRFIGHFSVNNSRLIIIGGILFYLGDLTVGLNIILPKNLLYILSTSCTWLFYLPAITLFALSGRTGHTSICK